MKRIKNFIYSEKYTIICFIAISLLIFYPYLFKLKSFTLGFDYQNQHLYFYNEFYRLMHSGEAPFWSWNLFLGTNFIGSKTYYLLGDPFAYLTLLFPASKIMGALFYITLLKLLVAALGMSTFLKELNISNSVRFIPTMMYTFCGWAFLFIEHPMYFTTFSLLPLIFFAIERYLNKGTISYVILSSFILLISNYYLFWTLCIFLVFYWPIRYLMKNDFNLKLFVISSLKLVGAYVLGCFMSFILILPAALHTMQNTRLADSQQSLTTLWQPITIYLDIIMRALTPNFDATWDKPLLFNTSDYRTNQLTLYSSVITYLFVLSYFFDKSRYKFKETWLWLVLYAILGIILITPYGGSLMHGLSEPTFRWTIMITIVNTIIVAKYLDNKQFKKIPLIITASLLIGTLILLINIGMNLHDYLFELQLAELFIMKVTAILLVVYLFILLLIKNHKLKLFVLSSLLVIELAVSCTLTLNRYATGSDEFKLGEKYDISSIEYLTEYDPTLYRVFTPIKQNEYSKYFNLNLYYGYRTVSYYDSMYQYSLADFLTYIGGQPTYWSYIILNPDVNRMLGVKYYLIAHDELDLIENLSNLVLIKEFQNESLYYDPNYLPMGFTYSNFISKSEALKLSPSEIDFENILILDDEDYQDLKFSSTSTSSRDLFQQIDYNQNSLSGFITINSPSYLFLSVPYDKGWTLKINNIKTDFNKVQGGFIGLPLDVGSYDINLTYSPPGFKLGTMITFISTLLAVCILIIEFKNKKRLINN